MSSSITIEGVPTHITRDQIIEALAVLGIDASRVAGFSGDTSTTALHVEVFSDGHPDVPGWRWTADGKTAATHRLTIPILDKEHAT